MKKKIYLAGSNGVVRFMPSANPEIDGIGADNIQTSLAVFIFNSSKVSLTYADAGTDLRYLGREIEWVGKDFRIVIAKNLKYLASNTQYSFVDVEKYALSIFKGAGIMSKVVGMADVSGLIIFNRQGKLVPSLQPGQEIISAPQFKLREAINFLNLSFNRRRPAVLEFDGVNYLPVVKLTPTARQVCSIAREKLLNKFTMPTLDEIKALVKKLIEELAKIETSKVDITGKETEVIEVIAIALQTVLENELEKKIKNTFGVKHWENSSKAQLTYFKPERPCNMQFTHEEKTNGIGFERFKR